MSDSKAKIVLSELKKFEAKKGLDSAITLLSDENSPCVVNEWLSTGCLALDAILGGGLPMGRITEIYGDNSTGKSLIAAQVAALAQQDDVIVHYIDTESAVSIKIMEEVGVDIDNLIYSSPDTIEDVFTQFEESVNIKHSKFPDSKMLLIWDSIAATSTKSEMEDVYGKATMGKHAQLMSQGLRKFTRKLSKEKICALFLNQTREKIGVMFGDNVATSGGKAVGFYASVRVELKLGTKIKDGKKILGMESRAAVKKNKVAMPFLTANLPIFFGHGIDDTLATFMYLSDAGILDRTGASYIINGLDIPKFTKKDWAEIYDANYDAISDIVLNTRIVDNESDSEEQEAEE